MWDKTHGGFAWQVDVTSKVMRPQKHLYGQAFAIYAISEYAIATGDKEALTFALDAFRVIDAKAHDAVHGGYREYLAADWTTPPAGDASPRRAARRQVDEHAPPPARGLRDAAARERRSGGPQRLIELVGIETHAVVRVGWTAHTDRHQADWTPILDAAAARVPYGHDLENIWLVADALDALNQPVAPYTDLFRNVFAYSRQHGWDDAKGGFYDSGPKGQPADRRQKVWWVQSEVIVAALEMYRQQGPGLPRHLREDLALHRHGADRLGGRRVVRVDRAGRHAEPRQQGHAVEGRLSQRPRAPAGARSTAPSPVAGTSSAWPRPACRRRGAPSAANRRRHAEGPPASARQARARQRGRPRRGRAAITTAARSCRCSIDCAGLQ